MKTYVFPAVAALLIISTGLVNAYWTGTLGFGSVDSGEVLKQFGERLKEVPLAVGDWEGTVAEEEMDAREKIVAGASDSLSARYVNRLTGQAVSVFLVSGHFRSIAQHTPDQCYVAAGFQMLNQPIHYNIETDAGSIENYTTVFKKDEHAGTQYIRVFWTWSYDGEWLAPNMPRVALVGRPALYKMYFITEVPIPGQPIEQNPAVDFMRSFMPLVNQKLFPEFKPGAKEAAPAEGAEKAVEPATS